jgi:anti-anti-sigma factor
MDTKHQFEVRSDADGVLWLSGELDLAQMDSFIRTATANVDGQREVVLDLSELVFLDQAGIGAIMRFADIVCQRGVALRNPRENVRTVLSIAGVARKSGLRIEDGPLVSADAPGR